MPHKLIKSQKSGAGNIEIDLNKIINNPSTRPQTNFYRHNIKGNKFVIITYWWGRGNQNKNLQYPCPEDIGPDETLEDYVDDPNYKPRETFESMIETWKRTIDNMYCYYYVQEYPEFAKPGMYQNAINAKPLFIQKALDDCSKLGFDGVVYIDGDMTVNEYPAIFNIDNVDFMARGWNIDPRSSDAFRDNSICFDPFVFETSGGIMYFGNTVYARHLLNIWHLASSQAGNKGKADDRLISLMFNALDLHVPLNYIQLPIEYLWLTDNYGEKSIRQHSKKGYVMYPYAQYKHNNKRVYSNVVDDQSGPIIFEHPACLTGEERATDQGASSERTPFFYYPLVEENIQCSRHAGIFYEYIFFDKNDEARASYSKYLQYMNNIELEDADGLPPFYIVPYEEGYGELTQIAIKNIKKLGNLKNTLNDILNEGLYAQQAATQAAEIKRYVTVVGQGNNNDILLILSNLMKGDDVLFLPKSYENIITYKPVKDARTYYTSNTNSNSNSIAGTNTRSKNSSNSSSIASSDTGTLSVGGALTKSQKSLIDHLITNVPVGCEFVAYLDAAYENDAEQYSPAFDLDAPMYFSHRSKILRHALVLSRSMLPSHTYIMDKARNRKKIESGFNDIFRSSFIFITRIRCKWLYTSDVPT